MQTDHMVFQAKSFYNAYIALEQISNNFDEETALYYYVPRIVNGALSIELTLKAILAKNGIDYGKEHNLLVLFEQLPESFQCELLGNLLNKTPEYADSKKCAEELILISNAFVDWRYFFEGNPAPAIETRFLAGFANAAICTMFAHYNVHYTLSTDSEKTDEEIMEMFRENREQCKDKNISYLQKKLKE